MLDGNANISQKLDCDLMLLTAPDISQAGMALPTQAFQGSDMLDLPGKGIAILLLIHQALVVASHS